MPLLFSDGRWHATLIGPTPKDPVEATAHKALRRQLAALTHVDLPTDADLPIQLRVGRRWTETLPDPSPSLSHAGYRIHVDDTAVTLVGGGSKGTLNAAYELLERMGLRWPVAAPDSLRESPAKRLEMEPFDVSGEPSFPRVTFFQDLRTLRDYAADPHLAAVQERNDRDLILWMGRHRFTGLFGNLPEAPEPWDEATRRGIVRQSGGHLLPRLLPRERFHDHPDDFPMNEAGERFQGNLCVSSEEALRIVCENARRYVEETAADVLHLWGEDVLGGKWCACPPCRKMSVSDQYLKVVNAVADHLAEPYPDLRIAYIAYHDTLAPKLTGTPHPNVVLLFAPRQRCYRHILADPACERNAAIYAGLQEYGRIFKRMHTFEYFGDALLWCSGAIVLPRLIVEDLRTYHAAGVVNSGCLMFGGYSWFSHPLNLYTFARASWDIRRTAEEIVEEFAAQVFPGAEATMGRYYMALEDAARLLVERTDWFYRVPQGDPEAARQLLEKAEAAEAAWDALPDVLNEALAVARPGAGQHLVRERQALRFTRHLVRAYRARLQAAALDETEAERMAPLLRTAEAEIRSALRILHDLPTFDGGTWGAEGHGEPRRLRELLETRVLPRLSARPEA